jgi:hypothetical protein
MASGSGIKSELLDELLKGQDPKTLFERDGLLDELKKALAERVLNAKLDHHLEQDADRAAGNHRNGSSSKTMLTDTGTVTLAIPRDRQSRFEPQLIAKYQRRFPGFDEKIIALYAGGMSTRGSATVTRNTACLVRWRPPRHRISESRIHQTQTPGRSSLIYQAACACRRKTNAVQRTEGKVTLLRFLVAMFACSFVFAQQTPSLPPGVKGEILPGVSIMRPEYAPPPGVMPPRNPMSGPQEITDLLRAQTEAINALTSKVDLLDERLRRIEGKLR